MALLIVNCRSMNKWIPVSVGSAVGLVFGVVTFFQNPRPAVCVFLQTPMLWVCDAIDKARVFPKESLEGLIVVIPLWFIYWTVLGALLGFLLWLMFKLFIRLRRHDDA